MTEEEPLQPAIVTEENWEQSLGTALISSDPSDEEASATARFLKLQLLERLSNEASGAHFHGVPVCTAVDFDNLTDDILR